MSDDGIRYNFKIWRASEGKGDHWFQSFENIEELLNFILVRDGMVTIINFYDDMTPCIIIEDKAPR